MFHARVCWVLLLFRLLQRIECVAAISLGKQQPLLLLSPDWPLVQEIASMAFSPDGRLLAAQGGAPEWNLVLWVWEKSKVVTSVKTTNAAGNPVYQVCLSVINKGNKSPSQSPRLVMCASTSNSPGRALMSMSHMNRLRDLLSTDRPLAAMYFGSPDLQLTLHVYLSFVTARL